jgi:hypothetical protein
MDKLKNLTDGVKVGARIEPDHILHIIKALTGEAENEITIKGLLDVQGNVSITGTGSIQNASVKEGIQIGKDSVISGSSIVLGDLNINGDSYFKEVGINEGLSITGSVFIKDLNQVESTKFISYNPETGLLAYSSGSLREDVTPVDISFQFDEKNIDQQHSFRGSIQDISYYNTKLITSLTFLSRVDDSPSWATHKDLTELQHWINTNIMGDRLFGTIFWIRIIVEYDSYTTGKSEVVIRYTTT